MTSDALWYQRCTPTLFEINRVHHKRFPVTAEVGSSSLVVPASFFNNLRIGVTADQGILRYNKRPIGISCTNQSGHRTSLHEG
jgi:hypothetical protein